MSASSEAYAALSRENDTLRRQLATAPSPLREPSETPEAGRDEQSNLAGIIVGANIEYARECNAHGWAKVGRDLAQFQADAVLAAGFRRSALPSTPTPEVIDKAWRLCEMIHLRLEDSTLDVGAEALREALRRSALPVDTPPVTEAMVDAADNEFHYVKQMDRSTRTALRAALTAALSSAAGKPPLEHWDYSGGGDGLSTPHTPAMCEGYYCAEHGKPAPPVDTGDRERKPGA